MNRTTRTLFRIPIFRRVGQSLGFRLILIFGALLLVLCASSCQNSTAADGAENPEPGPLSDWKNDFIQGRDVPRLEREALRSLDALNLDVWLALDAGRVFSEQEIRSEFTAFLIEEKIPVTEDFSPAKLVVKMSLQDTGGGVYLYSVQLFMAEPVEGYRGGERKLLLGRTWVSSEASGVSNPAEVGNAMLKRLAALGVEFSSRYQEMNQDGE